MSRTSLKVECDHTARTWLGVVRSMIPCYLEYIQVRVCQVLWVVTLTDVTRLIICLSLACPTQEYTQYCSPCTNFARKRGYVTPIFGRIQARVALPPRSSLCVYLELFLLEQHPNSQLRAFPYVGGSLIRTVSTLGPTPAHHQCVPLLSHCLHGSLPSAWRRSLTGEQAGEHLPFGACQSLPLCPQASPVRRLSLHTACRRRSDISAARHWRRAAGAPRRPYPGFSALAL